MEFPKNQAVVFIKPSAYTRDTEALVRGMFRVWEMEIVEEAIMSPLNIRDKIDGHYGVVSERAMKVKPEELCLPDIALEEFSYQFGMLWGDALARGMVKNAADASRDWAIGTYDMESLWRQAERENLALKMGSGLYVARIAPDRFVINGFYMLMRERYLCGGNMLLFIVSWSPHKLSWKKFHHTFIGCTDPSVGGDGSLRSMIYKRWQELGLSVQPSMGDNAIHGSASPLEALAEIQNWASTLSSRESLLKYDLMLYLVTRSLIPMAKIQGWMANKTVLNNGKLACLYDIVEYMDVIDTIVTLRGVDCENRGE